MANILTRIFRPGKWLEESVRRQLEETTQLSSIQSIAGFIQYITGQSREMDEMARQETGEQAYNAYRTNPMGYNFVTVMTNFLFGAGVPFSHPDEQTNDLLRAFLRKEKFRRKLLELSNGYHVDGIQFVPAYANTLTGEVKVRAFDTATVKNIVTAPGDYEEVTGLYREYADRIWAEDGQSYCDDQKRELVTQDQSVGGFTVRHFFVWKRPTVLGDTRGWSFLTPVLHYLVQFREFLKTRLNLQRALSSFAWNWKLTGLKGTIAQKQAEAAAFQAALVNQGAIATGTQIVTAPGDKDQEGGFGVEAMTSGVTAGNSGANGDGRQLALQVAVGTATPEGVATGDWSNSNLNSATLAVQTFIKNVQAGQTVWGTEGFLGEFWDWWLGIQRDARLITQEAADMPVNINWPIIVPFDLGQLKPLLEFMVAEGIITKRTAASLSPFDIDFDKEQEELKSLKDEEDARKAEEFKQKQAEMELQAKLSPQPIPPAPFALKQPAPFPPKQPGEAE
jgi:hypothetical protein